MIFVAMYWWKKNNVIYVLSTLFLIGALLIAIARLTDVMIIAAAVERLLIISRLPWFVLGVAFYLRFTGNGNRLAFSLAIGSVLAVIVLHPEDYLAQLTIFRVVSLGLWAVIAYPTVAVPYWLRYLGMISFPQYPLRQYVGYVAMWLCGYVAIRQLAVVLPYVYTRIVVVAILLICIAHLVQVGAEFRFRKKFEELFLIGLRRVEGLVRVLGLSMRQRLS